MECPYCNIWLLWGVSSSNLLEQQTLLGEQERQMFAVMEPAFLLRR
jgi:hypothetical protein